VDIRILPVSDSRTPGQAAGKTHQLVPDTRIIQWNRHFFKPQAAGGPADEAAEAAFERAQST
jgi:hypothetical protein